MSKEKVLIIFLIIIGLVLTIFLGNKIVKEGFTSNSVTFIAVPMADPNSKKATVTYPNNDINQLNFTLDNQTIQYTLTNTNTTTPITYSYNGSNSTTAKLIIPASTNTGPDQNVKQMFVITDNSGKITSYGSTTEFVNPSSSSSSSTSTSTTTSSSSQVNTNFDNYNHYSGTSSMLTNDKTYYGPNGGTAVITTNSDGTQVIKVTLSSNDNPIVFTPSKFNISGETFYGPNGGTATIATDNKGNKVIIIKNKHGVYIYKTQDYSQLNNQNDVSSTQYFGSTGYTTYPYQSQAYTGSGSQAGSSLDQLSSTISSALGSLNQPSSLSTSSSSNSNIYNSVLPQGIPRSQIPQGQEDLYILKSEVVPPVCPACPATASCPRQEPCPPCPPCGRCPEPSFECKKVPNYNAINNQYLPSPFVNSFASFGR